MQSGYPSDLSDAAWEIIRPLLPVERTGRPLTHDLRRIANAALSVDRTGCPWRYLPTDFPPHSTVSYHFYQ